MPPKDSNAVAVTASSDDKKKEGDKKKTKGKSDDDTPDAMSDEDRELKERLETCVSTVLNDKQEASVTMAIRSNALDIIVNELRTATSSMTSVPKPLKFLRPHFASIKTLYTTKELSSPDLDNDSLQFRARLADVLSVLAMTLGKPGACNCVQNPNGGCFVCVHVVIAWHGIKSWILVFYSNDACIHSLSFDRRERKS